MEKYSYEEPQSKYEIALGKIIDGSFKKEDIELITSLFNPTNLGDVGEAIKAIGAIVFYENILHGLGKRYVVKELPEFDTIKQHISNQQEEIEERKGQRDFYKLQCKDRVNDCNILQSKLDKIKDKIRNRDYVDRLRQNELEELQQILKDKQDV